MKPSSVFTRATQSSHWYHIHLFVRVVLSKECSVFAQAERLAQAHQLIKERENDVRLAGGNGAFFRFVRSSCVLQSVSLFCPDPTCRHRH